MEEQDMNTLCGSFTDDSQQECQNFLAEEDDALNMIVEANQLEVEPSQVQSPTFVRKNFDESWTVSDSMDLPCMFCGMTFKSLDHLSSHEILCASGDTESEKHFFCTCGKSFTNKRALEYHQANEKSGVNYEVQRLMCTFCGILCDNREALMIHESSHAATAPFTCIFCGKGFPYKQSLVNHLRSHTGEKPYKCPLCMKSFSRETNFKIHKKLHESGQRFFCAYCGKWFRSAVEQEQHEQLCYSLICGRPMPAPWVLRYPCSFCHKMFRHRRDLRIHERVHTGERPYVCGYCDKGFTQSQALTIHIRTHTGEKPYTCVSCGQMFRDTSALRKHEFVKHTFSPKAKNSGLLLEISMLISPLIFALFCPPLISGVLHEGFCPKDKTYEIIVQESCKGDGDCAPEERCCPSGNRVKCLKAVKYVESTWKEKSADCLDARRLFKTKTECRIHQDCREKQVCCDSVCTHVRLTPEYYGDKYCPPVVKDQWVAAAALCITGADCHPRFKCCPTTLTSRCLGYVKEQRKCISRFPLDVAIKTRILFFIHILNCAFSIFFDVYKFAGTCTV
ncbi:zinc finger, C2H2 type [Trichuris suis]|nr:zinc finger, C2H2 type [Trichuris suis]